MRLPGTWFILLAIHATGISAQNLVPNSDFEQYTLCPDYVSQIDRAVGWSRPTTGTSDYLNACLGTPFSVSVPDNEFGFQSARSGGGYGGFYAFSDYDVGGSLPNEYREYVTHPLASPLVVGVTYSVEFFVSLADASKYAVTALGALLSVNAPYRPDDLPITVQPQIEGDTTVWLDDKSGWMRVSGCLVADSAYAFITMGNFRNGSGTMAQYVVTAFPMLFYSYYFIEDVSVLAVQAPDLGPERTACDAAMLDVLNPQAGSTYTWSTGETGLSITVDESGQYIVTRDAGGCLTTDTIVVDIDESPEITLPQDTLVDFCVENDVLLSAEVQPSDAELLWSTGATTSSIIATGPGHYELTATSPNGCVSSASVNITNACVPPVFVPNAFTPDGDGMNDLWRPMWGTSNIAAYELLVFDRWGGTLFASNDPQGAWDAGQTPIGVYAYRLRVQDGLQRKPQEFFGHVAVVR